MVTVKNILVKFYSGNKTASQTDIILKHIDNIQVIFDEENLFEYWAHLNFNFFARCQIISTIFSLT